MLDVLSGWQYLLSWFYSLVTSRSILGGRQESVKNLSDAELVSYILDGNKQYFEIIVDRWGQKLFGYLYYYFAFDQTMAEDAVQEVFVHVWRKLDTYDVSKTFSTWLYTVARNRTIDRLRQQNRELSVKSEENRDMLEHPERTDENNKWKKSIIKKILEQLKDEYREVMILYYFEEWSYDEIAEIIGSNKNTVGTLVSRAKKKVKEIVIGDKMLCDALELDMENEEDRRV